SVTAPIAPPGPAAKPAPPNASANTSGQVLSGPAVPVDLVQLWANVIELVGQASRFTKAYLLEAHPISFAKNTLTIGIDPEFADHLGLLDNPKNRSLIQTKLLELGFPEVQVKFIKAEAPADWVRPVPAAAMQTTGGAVTAP